jgi:hypothetical protein
MASSGICSIPNCGKPRDSRGLCRAHYESWRVKNRHLVSTPTSKTTWPYLEEHGVRATTDDCVIWPFRRERTGYAIIYSPERHTGIVVSRIVCARIHGEPPAPDMVAAHSCGNGHLGCINGRHLRWATREENAVERLTHAYEAAAQGKKPRYDVKLTADKVRAIRGDTRSYAEIARSHGVSITAVWMARSRKTWKHVA